MFDKKTSPVSVDDWFSAIQLMSDLVMILDLDHKILVANAATLQITGLSESEILGRKFSEVFHCTKLLPFACHHESLRKSTTPQTFSVELESVGRVYMFTAAPILDEHGHMCRVVCTGKDITEQDKSKKNLQSMNRALQTLIECNKIVVQPCDELQLLHQVCRVVVDTGGYHLAWIGFAQEDDKKSVRPFAYYGYNNDYLEKVRIVWDDTDWGCGPTGTAIRTGKAVACQNILNDPQFSPWREQAVKRGYASSVALPLLVNDTAIGALNIYAVEQDAFNEQVLALLLGLASDVAYGITTRRINAERRQWDSEMAQKESEWANAMDFIEDAVYLVDLEDKVRHANKKFYNMTGLLPEQVIGCDITTIMHPGGEASPCPVCFARKERKDTTIIMEADHPDNPIGLPIQVMIKIIRDEKQTPLSVLMGVRDLSSVEELRRQGQIINQINEAVIATDLEGNITSWNNGAVRLVGHSVEDATGKNIEYLLVDEISYRNLAKPSGVETPIIKKTGETFWGLISSSNYHNQVGQKTGTIFIITDISQRKKAEKDQNNLLRVRALGSDVGHAFTTGDNLREMLQNCCQSIVERLQVDFARIWVYDPAQKMLVLQGSAGMYTHTDGAHGRIPVNNLSKIGYIGLEKKAILTNKVIGDPQINDQEWAKREGMAAFAGHPLVVGDQLVGVMALFSKRPLSNFISKSLDSIAERVAIGVERNQTELEKVKLHSQIRQMQKMEAIGTLAGGIAHDFNNILTPILGYGDLLTLEIDKKHPAQESIQEILQAGKRAKELVRQILAFSRQTEQERRPLQPQLIIKEALKLLRASIPATVTIEERIDSECATIMADPTEIHQIIMNLCTNAYCAMQEEGGILQVSVENVLVDAELAGNNSNLLEGPYIHMEVKDNGPGMDPVIVERIFEPYFTTKGPGEGTGMGLAMVHGIVQSLGGTIVVESVPGRGSSFTIYLPSLKKVRVESSSIKKDIPRGTEKILLVDDESTVLEFGRRVLSLLGYDVTARTSSIEALHLFQTASARFDLVIVDRMMPNMTGMELCEKIKECRADIPVILLTGFSDNLTQEQIEKRGFEKCVMKPILVEEIAQIIREVLDKCSKYLP